MSEVYKNEESNIINHTSRITRYGLRRVRVTSKGGLSKMNETQRLRIADCILPITDHALPITHYNRNIKYALKIDFGTLENLSPLISHS